MFVLYSLLWQWATLSKRPQFCRARFQNDVCYGMEMGLMKAEGTRAGLGGKSKETWMSDLRGN